MKRVGVSEVDSAPRGTERERRGRFMTLELEPGEHEVILRVGWRVVTEQSLVIRLTDGSRVIAMPHAFWQGVDSESLTRAGGRARWRDSEGGGARFEVPSPGEYVFRLPKVESYESLLPHQVVVRAGRTEELEIALRPGR